MKFRTRGPPAIFFFNAQSLDWNVLICDTYDDINVVQILIWGYFNSNHSVCKFIFLLFLRFTNVWILILKSFQDNQYSYIDNRRYMELYARCVYWRFYRVHFLHLNATRGIRDNSTTEQNTTSMWKKKDKKKKRQAND